MVARKVSVGRGTEMLDYPAVVGLCGCDLSLFGGWKHSEIESLAFMPRFTGPLVRFFVPRYSFVSRFISYGYGNVTCWLEGSLDCIYKSFIGIIRNREISGCKIAEGFQGCDIVHTGR